jgi:hypothetical protein
VLEGGEAPLALPAPGGAGAGDAGAGGAGGLAPRVEVVNGEIRVVEASLMVQAQPAAEARVVVEDAQARCPGRPAPRPPVGRSACRLEAAGAMPGFRSRAHLPGVGLAGLARWCTGGPNPNLGDGRRPRGRADAQQRVLLQPPAERPLGR